MKKRTYYILIAVLMLGVVAFYIWDLVTNNREITDNLFKFLVIELMLVGSLVRWSNKNGRQRVDFYEKEYAEEIGDAFEGSIQRKKLLCAIRLYNEDNYQKALKYLYDLKKECKTKSEISAVCLFTALCYTDLGAFYPAIDEYRELIKADSNNSRAYSNIGYLYSHCGDYKNAVLVYRKAIELDPRNECAYTNLANSYFNQHDYENAILCAERAIEIKPGFRQALSLLAIIYYLQNDKENCEKYFQMSVAAGQNSDELKEAFEHYSLEFSKETEEEPVEYETEE